MDHPLRRRGHGRAGGPLVASAPAASPDAGRPGRADHRAAAPAAERQGHRQAGSGLAGHGEPDPAAGAAEPARRYERARPGELIHLDIKKLNRFREPGHRVTGDRSAGRSVGAGWEFAHVCIDDASRLAFVEIKPDETALSAVAFLRAAVAYYKGLGVSVARVMTDNGPCYKAHAFRHACRELGLRQIRTRPYTPRTNGKAERFIQTALREWAYARPYPHSERRAEELPRWLHHYNWHRPHGRIQAKTPISRLTRDEDNLLTLHSVIDSHSLEHALC